jgi:uncharacterized protein (DUF58 family)
MFRRSGSSFDLKSIREYAVGDDPRRIDWKLMGRSDRPFVKEYYEEERDGVCVLADASGSIEAFGEDEALSIAASISWILGALGLPTSLLAFADGIVRRREWPRGGAAAADILAFCSDLRASGRTDIKGALGAARKISRYRRVVVVSDFLDPAFDPAACPFSRAYYVRLRRDFSSLAPNDCEVDVTDPETGAKIRMPWDAPARARYREAELALVASFGDAANTRGGARSSWYREAAPGEDRAALYWELLEALYD